MSEHGFLKPNPALFDLDRRKKKSQLAHELGQGAPCLKCGDKCDGFQLHFWRKVCQNCRCGKAEHSVIEEHDPGFFFVGKIFDRPLRTKEEELEFCYGNLSDDSEDETGNRKKRIVKFDWVPPNISKNLARRYLEELPSTQVPIAGSAGAIFRKQQLEKQFPMHDIEPNQCHDLTKDEINNMEDYISNVKENVVGQGMVTEVAYDDALPPPPSQELLQELASQFKRGADISNKEGTFVAKPYSGSISSSMDSSRNNSPSPTSSHEDSLVHHHPGGKLFQKGKMSKKDDKCKRCVGCKGELKVGDVAIQADRAGDDKLWHPKCFKCSVCKDILVDLLYYYDSGALFCARDYASHARIPRCGACDELIFAVEYTGAENKAWHLKHFCCYECDRPLAGHKYIPIEGQPHCLMCYQAKNGKVCKSCCEYINPEDQRISLSNDHWHARPECFKCAICQSSLLGKKMTKKNEMILCSSACSRKASHVHQAKPLQPEDQLSSQIRELARNPSGHQEFRKHSTNHFGEHDQRRHLSTHLGEHENRKHSSTHLGEHRKHSTNGHPRTPLSPSSPGYNGVHRKQSSSSSVQSRQLPPPPPPPSSSSSSYQSTLV